MSNSNAEKNIEELVGELLDPQEIVAFRPALGRALGSPSAALFLCQAIYWFRIASRAGDGWFFKNRDAERDDNGEMLQPGTKIIRKTSDGSEKEVTVQQSWEYELGGMGRREQESARGILVERGVLEEMKRGVPARLYFRVNIPKIIEIIQLNQQLVRIRPACRAETYQQAGRIRTTYFKDHYIEHAFRTQQKAIVGFACGKHRRCIFTQPR